jgi:hypothetical protein
VYYGVLGYNDRKDREEAARDFSYLRQWIDPLGA